MMTLSKQRKFTFNSLLEDIRGSWCCVIKVRQYIFRKKSLYRIWVSSRFNQLEQGFPKIQSAGAETDLAAFLCFRYKNACKQ